MTSPPVGNDRQRKNHRPDKRAFAYTPPLPLTVSPYFRWPPAPLAVLKWLIQGWLPLSERAIVLLLALVSWAWFHPALERCSELAADWIALIYLRNLALLLPLGTFHHQLHHRYFECNYDRLEIPMDRWTGNFHAGTAESHQAFLRRRREWAGA